MNPSKFLSYLLVVTLLAGLLTGCWGQEPSAVVTDAVPQTSDPVTAAATAEPSQAAQASDGDPAGQPLVMSLLFEPLDLGFSEVSQLALLEGRVWFHGRTDATEYACSILPNGTDLQALALMDWTSDCYITHMAFAPDRICYSTDEYLRDSQTAEVSQIDTWLCCLDGAGTQLFRLHLEDSFGLEAPGQASHVVSIAFAPDETVLFTTLRGVYHLDELGQVQNSLDIQTTGCTLVQGSGQVYAVQSYLSSDLLAFDPQTLSVGEPVFQPEKEEFPTYYSSGEDGSLYALLTRDTGAGAYRLDLSGTAAPEPLIPPEYWLSNLGQVFPAREAQWLCAVYNIATGGNALYLARLGLAPEKTVLTIGVGQEDYLLEWLLPQYNFDSAAYSFQPVAYTDEELRSALLTGNLPDLLLFDDYSWMTMNEDTCARAGMLLDLADYLDRADSPLTRDMLLPNLLTAQEQNGHLYTLAYGFLYRTIYTKADYGAKEHWTLEEFLAVARSLPENVAVQKDTQAQFLEAVLEWCLPRFVDEAAGTCDFETQLFYDLLELCRDRFPAEFLPDSFAGAQDDLLNYILSMGSLSLICQSLEQFGDAVVYTGFPDAAGGMLTLAPGLAVTTACQEPEAAWDLIAYLLSNLPGGIYLPVTQADFAARVERTRGAYDNETLDRAEEMVRETTLAIHRASVIPEMVAEEAGAYFAGDKTAQEVAALIQSRVRLYLAERS